MLTQDPVPADLFDLKPDALRCPHLAIDALRTEGPVSWVPAVNAYVVTTYAEIMQVLRQPTNFSTRYAGGQGHRSAMAPVLLTADPPEHTRQRALVRPAFTPGQIRNIEGYITDLADTLIDGFIHDDLVEIVSRFTMPLPMTVIANFLGVDGANLEAFKQWSNDITLLVGNRNPTPAQMEQAAKSNAEFSAYFTNLIRERRGQTSDDLVSVVANSEIDGDTLSEEEMLTMLRQLLAAGNDTTTNLLGSCLLMLARQPELYQRLRQEENFIETFIEEMLRLESPIQGLNRTALIDTTIGDVAVPEGSQVLLMYAGANRDPAAFEGPAQFSSERGRQAHLAFGFGTHFCIGAPLARAEARIALTRFASRIATIELAEPDEIDYAPSFLLRGLKRLDLRLTPA